MSDDDDNNNQEDSGKPKIGGNLTEEGISFYFVVFLSLLALVLVLSKFLHDRPTLASVCPEAGITILVGILAGFLIFLVNKSAIQREEDVGEDDEEGIAVADGLLSFSSTVFFVAILPPIIFNAGYHLKRELFFRHIKPIVYLACLGTAISALVVALILQGAVSFGLVGDFDPTFTELLTFGGLISATDPVSTLAVFQAKRVDPHLFYLVFGESVLNDAVGLVLFNGLAKFVGKEKTVENVIIGILRFLLDFSISFLGSLLLGVMSGVVAALLLKTVDMRHTGLLELSLYVLIMYLPFFLAEIMTLSGIVTILFTGIAAKQYCEPNLSSSTESESDLLFRVTAHMAETGIFLELGLSVFGLPDFGIFHWKFILWAVFACLVGRALNVYPIAFLHNRSIRRSSGERENRDIAEPVHHVPVNSNEDSTEARCENGSPSMSMPSFDMSLTPPSRKDLKIGWNTAHMLWFSGLRGAVAYACAKTFPDVFGHRAEFVATTMAIVLITVFLMGGSTEMLLNVLKIDMHVDEDKYMEEQGQRLKMNTLESFEKNYVRPCVIRDYGLHHCVTQDDAASTEEGLGGEMLTNEPSLEMVPQSPKRPAKSPTQESINSPQVTQYVGQEMTMMGHLTQLRQTGQISSDSFRKKKSLYDYGSR